MSKNLNWIDTNNAEPLYVKCDCYTEGLEVQYFNEDKTDKGFYVNYWKYGIQSRYAGVSLWDRVRFAFKLLFRGTLHGDQIIISNKNAKKIKSYLEDYLKYDENNS
tara:strand:+ start:1663 stop:1980 length:318 start_codon:yes stop_codon:yes gene_type:complete